MERSELIQLVEDWRWAKTESHIHAVSCAACHDADQRDEPRQHHCVTGYALRTLWQVAGRLIDLAIAD